MHYFIYRLDKPGTEDLRTKTRPAHLEYADTLGPKLVFAGPTLDDNEKIMNGSVWVVDAGSKAEAEAITAADPYEKVDLFQSKLVQPILKVIPKDTN
mgnify:CR=1 FL=1|jgi:uncharacterized protein